jgi:hypothetical protein
MIRMEPPKQELFLSFEGLYSAELTAGSKL